jgi:hypothetical protein
MVTLPVDAPANGAHAGLAVPSMVPIGITERLVPARTTEGGRDHARHNVAAFPRGLGERVVVLEHDLSEPLPFLRYCTSLLHSGLPQA